MKNLLSHFILVFVVIFISCNDLTLEEKELIMQERSIKEVKFKGFNVIVIDDCEYIYKKEDDYNFHRGYGWGYLAHKGNCKYCAERRKQEIRN